MPDRWRYCLPALDLTVCGYRCKPPHNVLTVPQPWAGAAAVSELVSGLEYKEMSSELRLATLEAVVLKLN